MWTFITDSAGSKYGAPIKTVAHWNNTARLDKAGSFTFEMPTGDSLAALLASKREAHCYKIIGGSVVKVGAGIIDKIETVVTATRSSMLRVSGGDLLRELTYRTVGDLSLYDVETVTPSSVQHHDPDDATPNTVMTNAFDDNVGTQHDLTLKSDEYIYIRYTANMSGAIFDLDSVGGKINDNAATMTVQYFDGGAWTGVADFVDGTADGGATLAKDGTMAWTRPADAETMVHNGEEGHWIRMSPSANLDEVGFIEVDVNADGPTATGLADIIAYAPAGWTVDAVNGYAATENEAYLFFAGENVLEALKILAEHTGEHFYLGAGKKIVWAQDDPVADPTACGYRAVPMYGGAVEANALVCLIQSLTEIKDGYKQCSRVYPHGAGMGAGRVDLTYATDSPPGGYTLSAANNYVLHDAADAALRIDKDITWPEVGRIEEDAIHSVHASNQLLASAVEYLSRHYAAQTSYSLMVVGLAGTVDPGETIPVTYWEYRDGSAIIDIDATLIILETTTAIDSEGIRTVGLTVATTDTWPESEGRAVYEHLRKAKRATGGAGPGGMQSGTGGGGDIHIVTHVKHRDDEDTLIRFLDDQITMDVGGKQALYLDDAVANVLLGADAGASNISGDGLVCIGDRAGYSGLSEDRSVAIGADAMRLATASYNIAIGYQALEDAGTTSDGDANVAAGHQAMKNMDTGSLCVGIGEGVMLELTQGTGLVAIGGEAMKGIGGGGGEYDIAIGYYSAVNLTTGSLKNVLIGAYVAGNLTSGDYNIVLGQAMRYNQTASNNIVIGHAAGEGSFPTTYANCVIIGHQAAFSLVDGSGGIFIGYQAGYSETGANKLYIENSNSATPLIYGEFDNDLVRINGDLDVTGDITLADGSIVGITGNEIITFNAAGTIAITGATLTLDGDISVGDDVLLADGAVVGITGNEIITFDAAGTIDFTGANVTMDSDLTVDADINVGIAAANPSVRIGRITAGGETAQLWFGTETYHSIKVTHGAKTVCDAFHGFEWHTQNKTPGMSLDIDAALSVVGGFNVGTATGAGPGEIFTSGKVGVGMTPVQKFEIAAEAGVATRAVVRGRGTTTNDEAQITLVAGSGAVSAANTMAVLRGKKLASGFNFTIDVGNGTTTSTFLTLDNAGALAMPGIAMFGAPNVSETLLGMSANTAGHEGISMYHDGTEGFIECIDEAVAWHDLTLGCANIKPVANKFADLGLSGNAWDDVWGDDWHDEPDYYYMDERKNRSGEIVPVDDLAIICGIKPSGEWDTRTGLPLIDDATLPEWLFTRDKHTGETIYNLEGKPYMSMKMRFGLSWGAIRQLDGYRQDADTEREAIRAEIAGLQERLTILEAA